MRIGMAVVLFAALGVPAASAQTSDAPRVSLKGGLNISKVVGADTKGDETPLWKRGFIVGGGVEIPLAGTMALQPEVLLVSKGARFEDVDVVFGTADGSIDITYLELPILLKWTGDTEADSAPFAYAGPSFALKVRARETVTIDGESDSSDLEDVKGSDLGLVVGGGFRWRQFSLEGRLSRGLSKIAVEDDGEVFDVKNMTLALLVGFEFGRQ